MEMDRHFIKEKIESGHIVTPFVSTKQKLVNVLTKGLINDHV